MGDQIHQANRAAISALVISALALHGCATTPNATVGYYLPKVDVDVKVTETVGCTKDGVIIANLTATSDTKYSADHAKGGYQTIAIRRLDGPLSDTTVGFDYYDDGRLKGFNSTSTGRGEEIIKSAIALARKLTGFTEASLIKINPCDKIATWGGDAKAITLVFVGSIPFDKAGGDRKPLDPDLASQAYLKELGGALGNICVITGAAMSAEPSGGQVSGPNRGSIALVLRQPAIVNASVEKFAGADCNGTSEAIVWKGVIQVPQKGQPFDVLIPHAASFGKQEFKLELSEAGIVTKLTYGKENGIKQAIDAGTAAADAANPSDADRTTAINAAIARRAAEQKLVSCMADPEKC